MILLNIDQKNFILSAVILTLVLILLILIIAEQYSLFKKKVSNGKFLKFYRQDTKTRQVEVDDFRNTKIQFKNSRNVTIDGSKTCKFEKPHKIIVDEVFMLEKRKKRLKKRTSRKVWSSVFYLICFSLIGLSIYQHFSLTLANFGGTSYATVVTGSMSKSNDVNKYLDEIDDLQQIKPYSLVTLHKVEDPKELEIFKIYAYKSRDNKLVIHRLVSKSYKDNELYYTFKGDANTLSDKYLVKASDVLYEYKGESNYPLGLIVGFSRSPMGFLALVYVIVGLSIIDLYESKKDKLYLNSLEQYINSTNKEQYTKLGKERIVEI